MDELKDSVEFVIDQFQEFIDDPDRVIELAPFYTMKRYDETDEEFIKRIKIKYDI